MTTTNDNNTIKLLIIGDAGCGKTSILETFSGVKFKGDTISTIGIDFKLKIVQRNGIKYKLQVWDTAGQERFYSITRSYYKRCQGIIIVYNITKKNTFLGVKRWLEQINMQTNEDIVKVLVGNKSDLNSLREVSYEEGETLARNNKIPFFETSAKLGHNIQQVFDCMVDRIVDGNVMTTEENMNSRRFGEYSQDNKDKDNIHAIVPIARPDTKKKQPERRMCIIL